MHQPDYRNNQGIMQMPWVFLHAIKDYYDMPWIASRYENIHLTFNITATLLEQLELYYTHPEQSDRFLSLWLQDVKYLQEQERKWLIKICKSSHIELSQQEHFTNKELLDLEVLFMLSWCGSYLKTNNKVVKQLIQKQVNFTQQEKETLLEELRHFVSGIWDFYKQLHIQGRISIATTPFYHPILPLLVDMKNAQKANSNTLIPQNYEPLVEDATLQVQKAKELFVKIFGYETNIFWPAEGAVDANSVALLQSMGVKTIATDETILLKSLQTTDKSFIYTPYSYKGMTLCFRDQLLSDLIGFEYRYKEAKDGVDDFISRLQKIQNNNANATAFVILDGENAWEFYKNNGFDFLDLLYSRLNQLPWCKTMQMENISQDSLAQLPTLLPGSWINGTFDTWVGESEKTRAWELLFMSKKDYKHHKESLAEERQKQIQECFLKAECSDWFWWYGSDHYSDFERDFDILFRTNLIEIYKLMDITVPNRLFIPISKEKNNNTFWMQPQSAITPTVDGKKDSFFEWMGCGIIDERKFSSTMQKQKSFVEKIYYGEDEKKLYFAFEGDIEPLCKDGMIRVIIDTIGLDIKIKCSQTHLVAQEIAIDLACKSSLELSIDKSTIQKKKIAIQFEIELHGEFMQILPSFGPLPIDLDEDYSKNWFV